LRTAFEAATRCLERHRDTINALNVFPVPDGDTGTNMLLTMRSVNEESSRASVLSAGAAMAAMAQGALLGARGNSGVILSQFFHGLALGVEGKERLSGQDLAEAFRLASKAADTSVSKPVDGTMLTVMRELSLASSRHADGQDLPLDALSTWEVALEAGKEALSRTPMQLAVLREAGVVDAGGQGVVTLLEGAWRHLRGENVDELELDMSVPFYGDGSSEDTPLAATSAQPVVYEEYLAATEHEMYGYCTQLLIYGSDLDVDGIRGELSAIAESAVVAGNAGLVKVHVHTHDPGPVISYAVALGTIGQVSMENMDQQHQGFVSLHRGETGTSDASQKPESRPVATAVLAVAWGDGFIELFKGLGCAAIITGGQTMNPSTQELLDAARGTGASDVILLPNNPNIIPVARQAATIAAQYPDDSMRLHVIPCRTIPQGIAALLAFNPEGPLDGNLPSMEGTLHTVKTIEVTRAVRPATLGGLDVKEGQHIGLVEGDLVVAADSAFEALQQTLTKEGPGEGQLITLYWGADTQETQAAETAAQLRETIPGVGVEVVHGGQPFYQYIASLE
jgi:DAK2 domain fusion protein YloV